jgi:hypothetical protein
MPRSPPAPPYWSVWLTLHYRLRVGAHRRSAAFFAADVPDYVPGLSKELLGLRSVQRAYALAPTSRETAYVRVQLGPLERRRRDLGPKSHADMRRSVNSSECTERPRHASLISLRCTESSTGSAPQAVHTRYSMTGTGPHRTSLPTACT